MNYSPSPWGNKSSALARPKFNIEDKLKGNYDLIKKKYLSNS